MLQPRISLCRPPYMGETVARDSWRNRIQRTDAKRRRSPASAAPLSMINLSLFKTVRGLPLYLGPPSRPRFAQVLEIPLETRFYPCPSVLYPALTQKRSGAQPKSRPAPVLTVVYAPRLRSDVHLVPRPQRTDRSVVDHGNSVALHFDHRHRLIRCFQR